MKIKKLFPKKEKNASTEDEIKNTKKANFIITLKFKLLVRTAKTGIKETGSIAINALKKF